MTSNYCTRVFGQLQRLMDREKIKEIVATYRSDYRTRLLFTWQHLQVMVLYQFCFAKSLRDLVSSYEVRSLASSPVAPYSDASV